MAATNGDSSMGDITSKAPEGTILPPPEARTLIEKTAGYVARNGMQFEEKIREKQAGNSKMSFLLPEDAYHAYYRWRMTEIQAGRGNAVSAGREGEVSFQGREVRKGPEPPEEFIFSARVPNISAQDLDVVKLTALFVAKNGRGWMTQLSQREAGNFQFDFLRPQHTLYQFFSRLVDQYTDLLTGDSANGGRPQKKRITSLEQNVKERFQVLDRAKKRAEWVKHQEAQKVAEEEKAAKDHIEYQQIDWHDFVVVETVVFDERDETADLPPPVTKNDLQSASLEQKAAMSIAPGRRIEEAFPSFNDEQQFYGQQQQQQHQQQQQYPQSQMPPPQQQPYYPPQAQQAFQPSPQQQEDNGFSRINTAQQDRDRARAAQEAARSTAAPMKIRSDYIPRAQQKRQTPNTSLCPNCRQEIPNEEFEHHMRIEMQSPEYREQAARAAHRSSTTNLSTGEVVNNLKRLASQRTDLFDPVSGAAVSEEEAARRKRAEVSAYDGVSGMPSQAALAGMTQPGEQSKDVQEQIRQLHQKFKG
jgi:splicing factor 3A subunit 1